MFAYVVDRTASLTTRATMECKEPRCGEAASEDGSTPCDSANCGEKLMLEGWRRELTVMRDFRKLLDWLEHDAMKKQAEADRKWKGRK